MDDLEEVIAEDPHTRLVDIPHRRATVTTLVVQDDPDIAPAVHLVDDAVPAGVVHAPSMREDDRRCTRLGGARRIHHVGDDLGAIRGANYRHPFSHNRSISLVRTAARLGR
jgi:hypothetical protein